MIFKFKEERLGKKKLIKILYKGRWYSFDTLSDHDDFCHLKIGGGVLYHRYINGDRDIKRLFRPKRFDIRPLRNKKDGKTIEPLGRHEEKEPSEILIAYLSEFMYAILDYWETGRIGEKKNREGKYPFFVERQEAIQKGWVIV